MVRVPPPLASVRRALPHLLATLALACGGKQQAPPQMPPPQVTVVTLKSEAVTLTRELPGRTTPVLEAEVRPQVNGIVERRLFTEGGLVKAGQPLYVLDDSVYRAEYENARAALAKAEAAAHAARLSAQRAGELRKIDAVSEQEKEDAIAAQRAAEADVAAGRAMVERNRVNLRYARIAAPISGRVGMSTVTPGALVTANQDAPLATVQQLDPIYVDVNQSSGEYLRLRREIASGEIAAGDAGTPVTIVLEDGSHYAHPGKLQATDVTVDEGTGSFALRILVPNPEYVLRPGMYVTAVLAQAKDAEAILAPQQGITRDPKGNASALVVGPDGKVALRQVKVSRTIGDKWLVDEGLVAGDRVIVEGLQKVQPGMPATTIELGSAPPPPPGGQQAPPAPPAPE
ncbi:MAG TPA: efflux RND transporter periplasmic adaptor subunit [Thermoanaerobaculia bacterium]|nr:efflux RND transporter periplasmic adaptor subunit [Thermoanaerobaculia bacterium]HXT52331.1 efflux RND transporter periplasmic adaptor subunit [Thermoanaerobaculia bacterium]